MCAGGIGEADPLAAAEGADEQPPAEPKAVDGEPEAQEAEKEDGQAQAEKEKQPAQQAGPRGIAGGAPQQALPDQKPKGRAHSLQQEQPQQADASDGASAQAQPQPQHDDDADAMDTEAAPQAQHGETGLTSTLDQQQQQSGAPLPLSAETGGDEDGAPKQQQPPQQQQRRKREDPNPFRSLGDALERWKASLSVGHDAQQPGGCWLGVWYVLGACWCPYVSVSLATRLSPKARTATATQAEVGPSTDHAQCPNCV